MQTSDSDAPRPRGEGSSESMDKAAEGARDVANEARRQVNESARRQQDATAEQATGLAKALRRTGEELDHQGQAWLRDAAYRVARDADGFATNMRKRDWREWADDGQALARRNPMLFLGGAVAAGFLLTRFLKSSDQREQPEATSAAPVRAEQQTQGNGASRLGQRSEVPTHASSE